MAQKKTVTHSLPVRILAIILSILVASGAVTYLIMFLMRSRFAFFYYLRKIILPELVYTVILTLVFYRLIYVVNRRLENDT